MVTYLPYMSDAHATSVAKTFEREIVEEFGHETLSFNRFYEKPFNGSVVAIVTLTSPLPGQQCNFYIHTNTYALNAVPFLPEKTDNNLIALSFYCAAESKGEYFPVTYRQG